MADPVDDTEPLRRAVAGGFANLPVAAAVAFAAHGATQNWGWGVFVLGPVGLLGGLVAFGVAGRALAVGRSGLAARFALAGGVAWLGAWMGVSGASGC